MSSTSELNLHISTDESESIPSNRPLTGRIRSSSRGEKRSTPKVQSSAWKADIVDKYPYLKDIDTNAMIHEATRREDLSAMCDILDRDSSLIHSRDSTHQTPLHIACQISSQAVFDLLVSRGLDLFDLNAQNESGKAPLHLCSSGNFVKILCEQGSNPNLCDHLGNYVIHEFVGKRNIEIVRVLLQHGANPMLTEPICRRTCLHLAAENGDYELLSLIVFESKHKLDVDVRDFFGFTALHLAAKSESVMSGQQRCVMLLLDKGANATLRDERGASTLHHLCSNLYLTHNLLAESMIDHLIREYHEIDVNQRDCEDVTPLIIACVHRDWSLCRLLLDSGADMNVACAMSAYFLQKNQNERTQAEGEHISDQKKQFDKEYAYLQHNNARIRSHSSSSVASNNEHGSTSKAGNAYRSSSMSIETNEIGDPLTEKLIGQFNFAQELCTASDLMPRRVRQHLFAFIRTRQSLIPIESRSLCMNCGDMFDGTNSVRSRSNSSNPSPNGSSGSLSALSSTSGGNNNNTTSTVGITSTLQSFSVFRKTPRKFQCKHCGRVVCFECYAQEISRKEMPDFIQDSFTDVAFKTCKICFEVIRNGNHVDWNVKDLEESRDSRDNQNQNGGVVNNNNRNRTNSSSNASSSGFLFWR